MDELQINIEPAVGRIPKPLPKNKKRPSFQSKYAKGKPVVIAQPGKYEAKFDFSAYRDEVHTSIYDIDFTNVADTICDEIAEQSRDALTRMNYQTITVPVIQQELKDMSHLYIAAKLMETAPREEQPALKTFHSVKTSLEKAPIPTPIVDIVNSLGNFESKDELWRLSGLTHKVHQLLDPPQNPDEHTIRSDADWNSFIGMFNTSDLEERETTILIDQATNRTRTLRPEAGTDFTDLAAITALSNDCEPGTALGQRAEVLGRHTIATNLATGILPAPNIQAQLVTAFQQTFNITIAFTARSPSQMKAAIALRVQRYLSRIYHPVDRIWNTSNASELTDQGSPSQLLEYNVYKTAASGPIPATPSQYCLTSVLPTHATILKRDRHSWRMNQSFYEANLIDVILSPSRKEC
jgi:hypothetical protein